MRNLQVSSPSTDMFKAALNNRRDDHMDRWTGMMVSMFVPAAGALVLGILLMLPLGIIRESKSRSGIYAMTRLAPAAGIVASMILGLVATLRLWRSEQGCSLLVCECGGLLGREPPAALASIGSVPHLGEPSAINPIQSPSASAVRCGAGGCAWRSARSRQRFK